MKFADFLCMACRTRITDVAEPFGRKLIVTHCGQRAKRLPPAPGLNNVKRYGEIAFGRQMTAAEVDRQLAKEGSWVASEAERKFVRDATENKVDPVIYRAPPNHDRLKKAVEQAAAKLKQQGKV